MRMPVDLLVVKASRLCSCVRDSSNIRALAAVKALLLDGDDAMVIIIELCCYVAMEQRSATWLASLTRG